MNRLIYEKYRSFMMLLVNVKNHIIHQLIILPVNSIIIIFIERIYWHHQNLLMVFTAKNLLVTYLLFQVIFHKFNDNVHLTTLVCHSVEIFHCLYIHPSSYFIVNRNVDVYLKLLDKQIKPENIHHI